MRLAIAMAMVRDLATLAEIVGQNRRLGPGFERPRRRLPSSSPTLRAKPDIRAASAYSKDGKLLAEYYRANVSIPLPPQALRGEEERSRLHRLALSHPITRNGAVVGAIYVESDWKEWNGALWRIMRYCLDRGTGCSRSDLAPFPPVATPYFRSDGGFGPGFPSGG